ncbi:hypothetical protein SDC9_146097 [bioreactor metagenome]|uniref:Uncharacterized protein n=1 Tax=bioreactor metagenome TaxID=1076179 RepID=A0A645EAD3_9ZZZZ
MEITIKLEDNADVSFIKKLLTQIKGVKSIDVSGEAKNYSWEEIKRSEEFGKVMEKSRKQIKNGEFVAHSQELMDSIFRIK